MDKLSTTDPKSIERSLETLLTGGILLFPTETVYGIGADSQKSDAIERLYTLKGRPKIKPFQWMVHHKDVARKGSTLWTDNSEKLAQKFWPGALTLVVPGGDSTIGWRIPNHSWLLKLLERLGRPLVATSANMSGEPAAVTCDEGIQKLNDSLNLAIEGGKSDIGVASTVVKSDDSGVEILRLGAITEEQIRETIK